MSLRDGAGVSSVLDGSIATITFSRPPVNALGRAQIEQIEERIRELSRQRDVKLIALSGRGRDFSAGTDISEHRKEQATQLLKAFHSLIRLLLTIEVPTAALVQGRALGGGAELALACDFIFAETTASFGFPEIRLGVFPPAASVLLERRVGRTKAADLILCGAAMTAEGAERRGLINALVNPGDLINALDTMRERLDPFSASTLRLAKRALSLGSSGDPLSALAAVERTYLHDLMRTEDASEGIAAFLEKRAPAWKNR
ncbi:MAG TPA: enoyl-CoA hydratase/isomerase family protein [Thermoanaerobaculia bacterium]|nr:enoyl-CoA hydratase/isomerase family protein [Thermoanaerobaculia bacterium]